MKRTWQEIKPDSCHVRSVAAAQDSRRDAAMEWGKTKRRLNAPQDPATSRAGKLTDNATAPADGSREKSAPFRSGVYVRQESDESLILRWSRENLPSEARTEGV
jgi:hypothetical protein